MGFFSGHSGDGILLKLKHLVGVVGSAVIFGVFGLMVGNIIAAITGVVYGDRMQKLATGETTIYIANITNPLGVNPRDIGLGAHTALVLPGIPVSLELGWMSLSIAEFTLAQVTGGGGAVFGAILGIYYALDVARKKRNQQLTEESVENTKRANSGKSRREWLITSGLTAAILGGIGGIAWWLQQNEDIDTPDTTGPNTPTPKPPQTLSSPDSTIDLAWEKDTVVVGLDPSNITGILNPRDFHDATSQAVEFWDTYLHEETNVDLNVEKALVTDNQEDVDIFLESERFPKGAQCQPEYESPGTRNEERKTINHWLCADTLREKPTSLPVRAKIGVASHGINVWTVLAAHVIGRKLGVDRFEGPTDIPINQGLIDIPVMDPRWTYGLYRAVGDIYLINLNKAREGLTSRYSQWGSSLESLVTEAQESGSFGGSIQEVGDDIKDQSNSVRQSLKTDTVDVARELGRPIYAKSIEETLINGEEMNFLEDTAKKAMKVTKHNLDPNGEVAKELKHRGQLLQQEIDPNSPNKFAPWDLVAQAEFATRLWERYMV